MERVHPRMDISENTLWKEYNQDGQKRGHAMGRALPGTDRKKQGHTTSGRTKDARTRYPRTDRSSLRLRGFSVGSKAEEGRELRTHV